MADFRIVLFALSVLAAVASVPRAESAVSCGQVFGMLSPCVNYLRQGGACPQTCCNGVKSLKSAASTSSTRKAVCGCLKNAAASVSGISLSRAASLPSVCHVNIRYKISPNTDCAKLG